MTHNSEAVAPIYYDFFPATDKARMEATVAEFGHTTAFDWKRSEGKAVGAIWVCTCGEHGEFDDAAYPGRAADKADAAIRAHRAEAHA